MTGVPQTPQPGWYPDTQATGGERWWDGERWTDQRRPMANYSAARSLAPSEGPLLTSNDAGRWGFFWAVVLPILGLIYGVILLRRQPQRGRQVVLVSVVAFIVYGLIFAFTGSR